MYKLPQNTHHHIKVYVLYAYRYIGRYIYKYMNDDQWAKRRRKKKHKIKKNEEDLVGVKEW